MVFKYGLEPVLTQRILIGFEALLEKNLPAPIKFLLEQKLHLSRDYHHQHLIIKLKLQWNHIIYVTNVA